MRFIFFFIFISSFTLSASELRILNFQVKESQKIHFYLDKKWKMDERVIGVNYLFSYSHTGVTDLISILLSPPGKINFSMSKKQEEQKYKKEKLKWLKKRGGKLVEVFPLKTEVSRKRSSYQFGMKYKIGGRDIIEFSQYHFCDGRLVYLKFLGESKTSFVSKAQQEILESFKCIGF